MVDIHPLIVRFYKHFYMLCKEGKEQKNQIDLLYVKWEARLAAQSLFSVTWCCFVLSMCKFSLLSVFSFCSLVGGTSPGWNCQSCFIYVQICLWEVNYILNYKFLCRSSFSSAYPCSQSCEFTSNVKRAGAIFKMVEPFSFSYNILSLTDNF